MKDILNRTFRPFAAVGLDIKHLFARIPTDLVGVAGFVAVATILLTAVDVTSPVVRAAVGFPLLFLAPGYAMVSVLFPRTSPIETTESTPLIGQTWDVTDVERVALAFGLSFALLPLLGLVIAFFSWGFTTSTVVGIVSSFVLAGVAVASIRRFRVPVRDRYQFRLGRTLGALRTAIFGTGSTVHTAVNVVLVVSMLLALTSVGYALVSPQQGEQYTDLQLLTEDDSGELVAAGYPSDIEPGESMSFITAIENQEGQDKDYTVVIQEQWINDGDVSERTELQRTEHSVSDGVTETDEQNVTPNAESGSVRIAVLLYDDEVPETPTTDNAYRHGYFWTEIGEDLDDE